MIPFSNGARLLSLLVLEREQEAQRLRAPRPAELPRLAASGAREYLHDSA